MDSLGLLARSTPLVPALRHRYGILYRRRERGTGTQAKGEQVSLSPVQVRIIANTEPFATSIREILAIITPFMWHIKLHRQRHRSRLVTRNKQRRNW